MTTGRPPWVVSDPHGHRVELVAALAAQGLVDGRGDWSAGDETLWFLGDFFDRGPDGVGVVELVMRLQVQAADEGGSVGALLGNHEILTLGMHRFGKATSPSPGPRASRVQMMWHVNGGRVEDQLRLGDDHLAWLHALPAVALVGDDLLLHSDTKLYLSYGNGIDEINSTIGSELIGDLDAWWECWNRLTHRYDFIDEGGVQAVQDVTGRLGGKRVVHGHSFVADLMSTEPHLVTAPFPYANGTALAVDGGLYAGGPLLLVDLAQWPTNRL